MKCACMMIVATIASLMMWSSPGTAHACSNVGMRSSARLAEDFFIVGQHRMAIHHAMHTHPEILNESMDVAYFDSSKRWTRRARRAAWVSAISMVRTHASHSLSRHPKPTTTKLQRDALLAWSTTMLEHTVAQYDEDPRFVAYLAEARALQNDDFARLVALVSLHELFVDDLLPDATSLATLIALKRHFNVPRGAEIERCQQVDAEFGCDVLSLDMHQTGITWTRPRPLTSKMYKRHYSSTERSERPGRAPGAISYETYVKRFKVDQSLYGTKVPVLR